MREYGITFDGASGLAEGHYLLHRRDGLSLPTVFGSFDAGVCGPIEGTAATRLCMAMGHELSKVERFCMHSAEATVVWSADGKPPQPKTIDEEIATLGLGDRAIVGGDLRSSDFMVLGRGAEEAERRKLPALRAEFVRLANEAMARDMKVEDERLAREAAASTLPPEFPAPPPGDLADPTFEPIAGSPVADDPSLPRLDPNAPAEPFEGGDMHSAEATVADVVVAPKKPKKRG